jgi:hypothetical protein
MTTVWPSDDLGNFVHPLQPVGKAPFPPEKRGNNRVITAAKPAIISDFYATISGSIKG